MAAEVRVEERHEEKEKSETDTPLTIQDFKILHVVPDLLTAILILNSSNTSLA